jgi:hypothetical protein
MSASPVAEALARDAFDRLLGELRPNDWKLVAGFVHRRPAVLVQDPREPARGWRHFVLLEWADDLIVTIRDFRYASYVIECAELQRVQVIGSS